MNLCVDFDDLVDDTVAPSMEILCSVKAKVPDFKATLFAIPKRLSDQAIKTVKDNYGDWIQLAPHGWRHTRGECLAWSTEEALDKLRLAADRGIDAPVFRAPAWLIDGDTYEACRKMGYIVASHVDFRIPGTGIPEYVYNNPPANVKAVHGHLTPCMGNFILSMKDAGELDFTPDSKFVYPQEICT